MSDTEKVLAFSEAEKHTPVDKAMENFEQDHHRTSPMLLMLISSQ